MSNNKQPQRRRSRRATHIADGSGPNTPVRHLTINVVDGVPVDAPADVPGLDPDNLPFMGEEMTCVLCGCTEVSDPTVESNWRRVTLGEEDDSSQSFYACPREFPPDGANADAFAKAYERFLTAALVASQGAAADDG